MALDNGYELVVRGMPYRCPDCGRNDQVVAFVHVADPQPSPHEEVGTEAGMSLAFAADMLQAARHPLLASIKRRSFPGGDETYLSNGCSHCDEIADPFQLADETALIQEKDEVHTLPILARGTRSIAEWALLRELSYTSEFDEF